MSHVPTTAKSILAVVRTSGRKLPKEEVDGRYDTLMPSLCVPELPRSYERLEQLLDEGFEVTAIARHPDNGKAHINTIMVGLRRG